MDEKVENKVFKRLFWLLPILYILALWPSVSHAQSGYTNVTATVTDPSNNPYKSGTYIINFYNPNTGGGNPPSLNGSGFQFSYSGALDGGGNLSIPLPDNGVIASSSNNPNTQWQFNICYSDRITCFTTLITITGSSQNITSNLKAASTVIPGASGFNFLFTNLETPAPATPAVNMGIMYLKPDKQLYYKNDTGTEIGPLGPSTAATAFSALTSSTNTTAAMIVGTGASLTFTGSGVINASTLLSGTWSSPGAIGGTAASSGKFTTLLLTGNLTTNITGGGTQCLHVDNNGVVSGTGSDCGSGGGSSAFSALTSSTNTTAAMVIGTGASLTVSGTGSNNATTLLAATWAAPAAIGTGTAAAGNFTTLHATGQFTSTVSTGTAPLVIASTTNVANLNASSLNGATFAAPGSIGGTTPAAGAFTTLSATGNLTTNVTGSTQCLHVNTSGVVSGTGSDCGSGGGGFTNPMTTLGDMIYENATPAAARLAGPTAQNVTYILTNTPSGGAAQTPAWILPGTPITSVPCTANAYTVLNTDRETIDLSTDSSACAVTLPQAGAGNFTNNFTFAYLNTGSGTVTITPTTSTINGGATIAIPTGWAAYIYSDNTNYYATFAKQTTTSAGSTALSALTAAAGANTLASGNNGAQIWGWAQTSNTQTAFIINDTTAATGTNDILMAITTSAGSTEIPLVITGSLTGAQVIPTLKVTPTWNTSALVDAGIFENVTNTASATGSLLLDLQVGGTSQFSVDKAGNVTTLGSITSSTSVTSSGTTAGAFICTQGTDNGVGAANTITLECPTSVTAYEIIMPGTAGTANQLLQIASVTSSKLTMQWGTVSGGSSALSSITAAAGANTIANGDNAQVWNWALTTSGKSAFTFGETTAATSAGTPFLVNIQTLATSTANPLVVTAVGTANGFEVTKAAVIEAIGTGAFAIGGTAHGVIISEGATTAIAVTAVGATGVPLIGQTGADPIYGAINLAGGSSIVTGVLPAANVASIPLNQVISPTGAITTIADGNNPLTINCAQTTNSQSCITLGETTAATGTTDVELSVKTIATSTAIVEQITQGAGIATTGNAVPAFFSATGGAGGAVAPTAAGNAGGFYSVTTGAGSAGGVTSGPGGAAGDVLFFTAAGGNATAGSTTGRGGNFSVTLGAAGATGTLGAPGQFLIAANTVGGANTSPFLNITGTWNTSGVVDAAIFENITVTAEGAASKLLDLQASATSEFNVDYLGNGIFKTSVSTGTAPTVTAGTGGLVSMGEGTALTGAASTDDIYANATNHCLTVNNNNTDMGCLASVPAVIDLTAQSAAKTATNLYLPASTQRYKISCYLKVTTAATTSSVLGGSTGVVITYTDGTDSVAQSVTIPMASQAGNTITIASGNTGNSTTTVSQGEIFVYAKTGVQMQYAIGYTSVGGTAMVYEAHLEVEAAQF